MTYLDAALGFAHKRLPVFPCQPSGEGAKRPYPRTHGFKDATTDEATIRSWWSEHPDALVAMPTGEASGFVVLDVDMDRAALKDGEASLNALLATHGAVLPETRIARTPRGGRHIFFKHPGRHVYTRTDYPAQCLDVRGDGGYVIVAPSQTSVGRYEWVSNQTAAPMPTWLETLLTAPIVGRAGLVVPAVAGIVRPLDDARRVRDALSAIPSDSRDIWLRIGFAVNSWDSGESGYSIWRDWSSKSEKFDEAVQRRTWSSMRTDRPAGVTIAALFGIASEHGWQDGLKIKTGSVAREYLGAERPERQVDNGDLPPPTVRPWPAPVHPAAFHGLAGDFVRAVEPHTEGDLHAVLILFLSAFGNMAGPAAYYVAQSARHPGRIWPVLVGATAGGRKGSAWSSVREVLRQVDEGWGANCVASGLSSGEGLIWAVRDQITKVKKSRDGGVEMVVEDPGVADKRLLTIEEEFTSVLKCAGREGNTVSDTLRKAWDSGNLRSLTKNSPAQATGAHITVSAHVTTPDLKKHLAESDALNGFGNRFLWSAVRRSKQLPFGGDLHRTDLTDLIHQIRRALDHARTIGELRFAEDARPVWEAAYAALAVERPGLLGALTQRAEAQVARVSLLYSLLDRANAIGVVHLRAALAVWDYCERSAAYIFGDAVGDVTADRILDELRTVGTEGLSETQIRDLFHRNCSKQKMANALALLRNQRKARHHKETTSESGGRPVNRWFATNDKTHGITMLLADQGTTKTTKPPTAEVMSFMSSVPPGPDSGASATWPDESPLTEPPGDLPKVDANGHVIEEGAI